MKRMLMYFSVAVLLISLFSCNKDKVSASKLYAEIDLSAAPNTLTEKEKQAGWQLLFDGKTFSGWHGYNMQGIPDVWAIEDGTLTMGETGGHESQDIITDKLYRNFALTVEYKLSKASNSGVVFQVKEDTLYEFPYETGPEFQLIDQENFPWPTPLEDWQIHGANYAMYPPQAAPYHPVNEWNRLLLVVDGNHVTQLINGIETVSYDKYSEDWTKLRNSGKWADFPDYGKFDEGNISLQNHGTKLWYRNVKIKQL
ncbi:glycosyl hydrolase [Bacteroidia bacterium]|nr:glycosyl hydrolase [Bacteroidia bacterium]